MKYTIEKEGIKIYSLDEFNAEHILECGQVFCYKKDGDIYKVFPGREYAEIIEKDGTAFIKTSSPQFFVKYFDLDSNYSQIKDSLKEFQILKKPIEFGYGIRILNQDLFETLISFIVSSNNNIKRIQLILNNLRKNLGEKMAEDIYSFPTFEKLLSCSEEFFVRMGAGYRASYLYKVLRQIDLNMLEEYKSLPTDKLREKLLTLSGVGPKVADCVLLFGYHRGDVFPVDTWIYKMYNNYYPHLDDREKIRNNLTREFKLLSGYAQQYLFFYQRSGMAQ